MIALDPAAHLAFEIAPRFAQIGEANRIVIEAVKKSEIVEEGLARSPRRFRGEIQAGRDVSAKDDPVNGFHQIKRSAQHGCVVAEEQDSRRRRIVSMKLGEHTKFAAHVMSRLDLTSEWRTAKNHIARTELHGIGEIRMAARVLTND